MGRRIPKGDCIVWRGFVVLTIFTGLPNVVCYNTTTNSSITSITSSIKAITSSSASHIDVSYPSKATKLYSTVRLKSYDETTSLSSNDSSSITVIHTVNSGAISYVSSQAQNLRESTRGNSLANPSSMTTKSTADLRSVTTSTTTPRMIFGSANTTYNTSSRWSTSVSTDNLLGKSSLAATKKETQSLNSMGEITKTLALGAVSQNSEHGLPVQTSLSYVRTYSKMSTVIHSSRTTQTLSTIPNNDWSSTDHSSMNALPSHINTSSINEPTRNLITEESLHITPMLFSGYSTEVSSSVNTPKTPVADIHNTSSKASSRFLTPVQSAEFPRITTASEKSSSDSEVLTTAAHESTASGKTTLLESSHRPQSAVISKASTPVVPLPPKTMPLITETIGTQIETRIGTLMIERSISSKPHSITDTDIVSQFPHSSVGVTNASKLIESVFETLQHSSTITLRDSTSFQVLSDNSKPNSNTKSQFSSSSPSLQSAPPMENTVNSITETQTVVPSSVSKLQDSMLASSNTPSTHTTRSYQFSIPSTSSAVLTPKLTRAPSSITKIAQVFSVFSGIPQVSVSSNNTGDTSSLAHKVTTDIDEQTSLHQILSNATVNSLPMQTFKVVIFSEINSSQKLPQTWHKLLSVTSGFQSTKTSDIISKSKITIAVATIETTTSNMNATKDKNTSATTMFGNTAYYSGTVSEISSNLMVENTPSQNTHGSTVNALSTASFWASNPAAATSLPSSLSLSLAPTVLSQASGTENVQSAVDSLSASTTRLLQNIRKSTLDIYGLKLSTGSSWRSDSTKSTLVSINAAGFASSVQSTDMHEIRKSQSWLFTITARSSESISVSIYMSSADPSQTSNPTTTFESTSPSNVASTILSQISRTHKTQSEQHSLSVMIPQPSQTIRRSTSNTLSTDFVLPSSPTTSPTTTPASIPFSSIVLSQTANLNKTQRGGRSPSRLRIKSNASTKTSSHDKTSVTTKTTENATFQHTNTTLSKEAVIRPTPSIFDTKQTKPLNSTILVTNNTNQPNTLRQPATTQLTSSISRNNRPLATQTCYSSNGQRCVCYKGQRVVRRDEQVLPCSQLLTEQERQAVVVMELETLVLSQKFENRTKTTIAILVTEACNNGTYQCFPIARENNSLHSGINNHSLFAPPNSQFSANEMATTKDHGILRNFSITPHATNPVIHRMQNSLTMSIGNLPNVSRIQPWRTRSTTVLPVDHASVKFKRKRRKRSLVTRKVSIRVTASDVVVIEMRPVENNKPAWLTFLVKYRAVNSSDNLTRLLQPGTLSYIIVNNTKYLERMLNVSIRGVRVWEKQTVSSSTLRTRSFETFPTATGKSSSSVSKSVTDRTSSEAVNDDSKIMLVAIIVGVSCVLILLIIIAIVMVRINSKWQGEFIPNNQNGTVSPDHNTQEMITAGVDPAPRITDVPFKSPKPKKTTKMSLKRSEIMTSEI